MEKTIKNITAERIVIGILLNHPDWQVELNGLLKTEFFYLKGHKTIFYIIYALLREGAESIDAMSIMARAEKINKAIDVLNENGGIEYLEELRYLAEDYTLSDLKRYAEEVATASFKRDLIEVQESIYKQLHENPDMTISQIDMLVQERQGELLNRYSSSNGISFIGDVMDSVWQEIVQVRNSSGVVGLPSKIELVNRYFTYLNGELIVIGARAR